MLRLVLQREPTSADGLGTLGVIFVDGRFFGFTLEDVVREVAGAPVDTWKVPGRTAIPVGRYPVVMRQSQKLQRPVPWVESVPGFSAIQIHPLNVPAETDGCIGVGYERAVANGLSRPEHWRSWIGRSRVACDRLAVVIAAARGVTLEIRAAT